MKSLLSQCCKEPADFKGFNQEGLAIWICSKCNKECYFQKSFTERTITFPSEILGKPYEGMFEV